MNARTRNVTGGAEKTRSRPERWNHTAERQDPGQKYFLYRLCICGTCSGVGRIARATADGQTERSPDRCPDCRGEGRTLDLVATCGTPEAVGAALVRLAREGEFDECPLGILDTRPEPGERKWLVSPWLPSPRNVTDAARLLGHQPKRKGERT